MIEIEIGTTKLKRSNRKGSPGPIAPGLLSGLNRYNTISLTSSHSHIIALQVPLI